MEPATPRRGAARRPGGRGRAAPRVRGFRRRKAEIDRAQDRLPQAPPRGRSVPVRRGAGPALPRHSAAISTPAAWSLVAEPRPPVHRRRAPAPDSPARGGADPSLSSPFEMTSDLGVRASSGPTLADRLADLRTADGPATDRAKRRERCSVPDRRPSASRRGRGRRPPLHLRQRPDRASISYPRRCRAAWACSTSTATAGSTSIASRAGRCSRTPTGEGAPPAPAIASSATGATAPSRTSPSGRGSPRSPGAAAMGWASRSATTTTTAGPTP